MKQKISNGCLIFTLGILVALAFSGIGGGAAVVEQAEIAAQGNTVESHSAESASTLQRFVQAALAAERAANAAQSGVESASAAASNAGQSVQSGITAAKSVIESTTGADLHTYQNTTQEDVNAAAGIVTMDNGQQCNPEASPHEWLNDSWLDNLVLQYRGESDYLIPLGNCVTIPAPNGWMVWSHKKQIDYIWERLPRQ